jgi:hypothetical protein
MSGTTNWRTTAFAEFERDCIRDRIRAGMRSARAKGRHIGRPHAVVDVALLGNWVELFRQFVRRNRKVTFPFSLLILAPDESSPAACLTFVFFYPAILDSSPVRV